MSSGIKDTALANMNVKLCNCTLNFSQGSAATDLRGVGSFKSNLFRSFFLNLTVKRF